MSAYASSRGLIAAALAPVACSHTTTGSRFMLSACLSMLSACVSMLSACLSMLPAASCLLSARPTAASPVEHRPADAAAPALDTGAA